MKRLVLLTAEADGMQLPRPCEGLNVITCIHECGYVHPSRFSIAAVGTVTIDLLACRTPTLPTRSSSEDTGQKHNKKLHGLSPRANYTDRATAACRRSDCQLLRIEGPTWSA
jgi:hypothetical protein